MSLPYMEFYVGDYQAATAHLEPEEDGIYLRLLILCWQTPGCSIPNDETWIERRMRMRGQFEKIGPILNEFFTLKKGRYFQKKQMKIFERSKQRHERRSEAGRAGAEAKALKNKEKTLSKAKANGKQSSTIEQATRTITTTNKEKDKKESFEEFWKLYPRKVGKGGAKPKYLAALNKTTHAEIMAGLKAFPFSEDKKFIPHPATWLYQERWLDEIAKSTLEVDYSDADWWRERTKTKFGKEHIRNNWPVPGRNFPDGCPIATEIWGGER